MSLIEVSVDELEDYRFCPTYYNIKKKFNVSRYVYTDPCTDSIKIAIDNFCKTIFTTNVEPRERDFLNLVMKVFDKISNLTKEERFFQSKEINKMLDVSAKAFQLLERHFNNILLHPVVYDFHAGHGDIVIKGKAYPIIKDKNKPSILICDHGLELSAQYQFTNMNLAGYKLWLHDNLPEVKNIIYLNTRCVSKGLREVPVNFKDIKFILKYFTDIVTMIRNDMFFTGNLEKCNECLGSCLDYLLT